jgi:hypothetical protein
MFYRIIFNIIYIALYVNGIMLVDAATSLYASLFFGLT